MKVEVNKSSKNSIRVSEVIYGSVVKYKGEYWIKSSEIGDIVRLEDGRVITLTTEPVEVVKARVIIED